MIITKMQYSQKVGEDDEWHLSDPIEIMLICELHLYYNTAVNLNDTLT